ncbi:hypothetical protein CVT26_012372 [Gymnopilus dilepis]|uniref:Uncharacterized protein n=1 Tax=Gymnopilus dilepis TaxID=231916 RepID=A0A409WVJ7_9AGAR|nr:hypothetical protein CVT26_012372 [Gymnopilus dilepis]
MSTKTALELALPFAEPLHSPRRRLTKLQRGSHTVAREIPSKHPLPILDIAYRSRQLAFRRSQISQWLSHEHRQLQEEVEYRKKSGEVVDPEYISSRVARIEKEAAQQEKDALAICSMLEGSDPHIAPLRRALAVWGPTADDIGALSIQTRIWNDIFTTTSRFPGNAVLIIAKKKS